MMEGEDFKKKIIEILKDISYTGKTIHKKTEYFLQQLDYNNDSDKDLEHATLGIVKLLQQFSEIFFPTLNSLDDIARIKKEGNEVFYEQLRSKLSCCKDSISLLRPENTNVPGPSLIENNNDVKNNNKDQVSVGPSLLPISTDNSTKRKINLSLKKTRRSGTPDTDDAWNDTLKRIDPNDVFGKLNKNENIQAEEDAEIDDDDAFERSTVAVNYSPKDDIFVEDGFSDVPSQEMDITNELSSDEIDHMLADSESTEEQVPKGINEEFRNDDQVINNQSVDITTQTDCEESRLKSNSSETENKLVSNKTQNLNSSSFSEDWDSDHNYCKSVNECSPPRESSREKTENDEKSDEKRHNTEIQNANIDKNHDDIVGNNGEIKEVISEKTQNEESDCDKTDCDLEMSDITKAGECSFAHFPKKHSEEILKEQNNYENKETNNSEDDECSDKKQKEDTGCKKSDISNSPSSNNQKNQSVGIHDSHTNQSGIEEVVFAKSPQDDDETDSQKTECYSDTDQQIFDNEEPQNEVIERKIEENNCVNNKPLSEPNQDDEELSNDSTEIDETYKTSNTEVNEKDKVNKVCQMQAKDSNNDKAEGYLENPKEEISDSEDKKLTNIQTEEESSLSDEHEKFDSDETDIENEIQKSIVSIKCADKGNAQQRSTILEEDLYLSSTQSSVVSSVFDVKDCIQQIDLVEKVAAEDSDIDNNSSRPTESNALHDSDSVATIKIDVPKKDLDGDIDLPQITDNGLNSEVESTATVKIEKNASYEVASNENEHLTTEVLKTKDSEVYSSEQRNIDIGDELLELLKEVPITEKSVNEEKKNKENLNNSSDEALADEIIKMWEEGNNSSEDEISDSESISDTDINIDDSDVILSEDDKIRKNDEKEPFPVQHIINFQECFVHLERIKIDPDVPNAYSSDSSRNVNNKNYDSDDRLCDLSSLTKSKRKHSSDSSIPKIKRSKKKHKKIKPIVPSSSCSSSDDDTNSSDDIMTYGSGSSSPNLTSDLEKRLDNALARDAYKELSSFNSTDTSDSDNSEDSENNRKHKIKKDSKDGEGIDNQENEKCGVKKEKITEEEKKRKSWKNDPLLRGKLSSDSEESWKNKRKKKKIKFESEDIWVKSETESESDDKNKIEKNKATLVDTAISPIKRNIPRSDSSSDTDSDIICISPNKKNETELNSGATQKGGRRNIRALVSIECLTEATQKANKEEEERIERLEERQKLFETLSLSQSFTASQTDEEEPLVLDIDDSGEPLVTVHSKFVQRLKPHQKEGIRFMWNSSYESIQQIQKKSGSGCILAHCMGLGKTFQIICLIHTLFAHRGTTTKHVLVVCPLSTVNNWKKEVKLAFKDIPQEEFALYTIGNRKDSSKKYDIVAKWHLRKKAVLILGYECFETLTNVSKLEKNAKQYSEKMLEALINPGPDLVVCDEGHLLRNKSAQKTLALNNITTKRRIVLTGTPLQNNLLEYYYMVNFVKPNLLGNLKEYKTNFVNPITNGQYEDSTKEDIKLMKSRTHVLHRVLAKTIHRVEDTELKNYLPKMIDHAVFIKLDQAQVNLYQHYSQLIARTVPNLSRNKGSFLSDFHTFQHICTHPFLLSMNQKLQKKKIREHDIITKEEHNNPTYISDDWWKPLLPKDSAENINYGTKLCVLKAIIDECEVIEDKLLVFSQSLAELDLIEHFLKTLGTKQCSSWKLSVDYLRMDGTVATENRTVICDKFNDPNNKKIRVLLMSTKVGGLGLNLTAANRVVIMTVNWNPSYDTQSVFRVYRFGQTKEVYVYRLISMGTMEEKVYQRTVTKLAISHRVVDKHQITRHYKSVDLAALYDCQPNADNDRPTPVVPEDKMLGTVICDLTCIFSYHEHQGLLEDRPEDNLNEAELAAAWEEFQVNKNQQNLIQQQQQLFQNQQRQLQLQQQYEQQQRNINRPALGNMSVTPTATTTLTTSTLNSRPTFADGFNIGRSHLNQISTEKTSRGTGGNLDNSKQYFIPKPNGAIQGTSIAKQDITQDKDMSIENLRNKFLQSIANYKVNSLKVNPMKVSTFDHQPKVKKASAQKMPISNSAISKTVKLQANKAPMISQLPKASQGIKPSTVAVKTTVLPQAQSSKSVQSNQISPAELHQLPPGTVIMVEDGIQNNNSLLKQQQKSNDVVYVFPEKPNHDRISPITLVREKENMYITKKKLINLNANKKAVSSQHQLPTNIINNPWAGGPRTSGSSSSNLEPGTSKHDKNTLPKDSIKRKSLVTTNEASKRLKTNITTGSYISLEDDVVVLDTSASGSTSEIIKNLENTRAKIHKAMTENFKNSNNNNNRINGNKNDVITLD